MAFLCYNVQNMKHLFLFIFALFSATVVSAQNADTQPVPYSVTPLAQAIENAPFITSHKPNPAASYYMYFFTASWCSPCRAVTPKIIAEYPAMMTGRHMEVILVSLDDTPEKALAYLSKYNAPFAAVMLTSLKQFPLPGCPSDMDVIPHIIVVDAHGNFIYRGHALRFAEWKERTATCKKNNL